MIITLKISQGRVELECDTLVGFAAVPPIPESVDASLLSAVATAQIATQQQAVETLLQMAGRLGAVAVGTGALETD